MRKQHNPLIIAGVILLTTLMVLAVLIPLFSPWSPSAQNVDMQNTGTSLRHLFGTDKLGRDLFVRVWYGARISILVGMGSAVICGIIGLIYGSWAGYEGGRADMVLMRIADVIDAIPSLLCVILIMLVIGPGVKSVILGVSISGWIPLARVVRGEVQRLKVQEFSVAARLYGAGAFRILAKHILPNAAEAIGAGLTLLIPKAIFTEAFLSFVGVGISAPTASLGTLIQEARSQMLLYPSQMAYPIVVLCMIIMAVNLIGAGMTQRMRAR